MEEEAVKLAIEQIKRERKQVKTKNVIIICLSVLLCVTIICGTVLAIYTIREQQYALNLQYAQLFDLIAGAEIVEDTDKTSYDYDIDGGDNGVAILGDGNSVAGGDINGSDKSSCD